MTSINNDDDSDLIVEFTANDKGPPQNVRIPGEVPVTVPHSVPWGKVWAMALWRVMQVTGKGYRKQKTNRHSGEGKDRRKDKLEFNGSKRFRQYSTRRGV